MLDATNISLILLACQLATASRGGPSYRQLLYLVEVQRQASKQLSVQPSAATFRKGRLLVNQKVQRVARVQRLKAP